MARAWLLPALPLPGECDRREQASEASDCLLNSLCQLGKAGCPMVTSVSMTSAASGKSARCFLLHFQHIIFYCLLAGEFHIIHPIMLPIPSISLTLCPAPVTTLPPPKKRKKEQNHPSPICLYIHWREVQFFVACPLSRTESFSSHAPARKELSVVESYTSVSLSHF